MPRVHGGPRPRFRPRVTLALLGGVVLFVISSALYALPALLETPPPGAIADYTEERVRARLEGKALWLLAGSLVLSGALCTWWTRDRP